MERTIGNLGQEIRLHSSPYQNLSQRAVLQAQINAFKAMIPDLEPDPPPPHGSVKLEDGYTLLRKRERTPKAIHACEATALNVYCQQFGVQFNPEGCVRKWARLGLPSGQIARSAWGEDMPGKRALQHSRHVKVHKQHSIKFKFYFNSLFTSYRYVHKAI
ncbi:hypothetical protein SERLADRAFT_439198 [Serpula lacrymans var. lacrymans S7.9]|uniref:Uncharacterized protein n=1 Tax=Serpula lacrymans var. lacrymans (strain S7.9) TaxID=578457 RepID=F8NZ68_SERL9|nr:uncharacterized protein SERLADRAFT_439198 [Serpula lacrymans var. lacrymans S7.9]EGO23888.1 hypothetical protein SERLADRAFT_439198 [Serpula lacrymans var. lacrymans S7.9]